VINSGQAEEPILRYFVTKVQEENARHNAKYRTDLVLTKKLQLRSQQLRRMLCDIVPMN